MDTEIVETQTVDLFFIYDSFFFWFYQNIVFYAKKLWFLIKNLINFFRCLATQQKKVFITFAVNLSEE